jgi:hypothetical protein
MTNEKAEVERRKHKRSKVHNDTFVVLRPDDSKVGSVIDDSKVGSLIDITTNGLTFRYVGREEPLSELAELGIYFPDNDFYLFKVPCKIISDLRLYKNHPSPITTRRCGVQFRELTHSQVSQLQHFILNYTAG